MKKKFDEMVETLGNGNISDFRKWLKSLSKANLMRFTCHCVMYSYMDVFEIEKHLNS